MKCSNRHELLAWSRQGSHAALDPSLEAHTADCEDCGSFLLEVHEGRRLGADVSVRELTARRRDEIRFALMAEARRKTPVDPPRVRVGLRVMFAVLLFAAVSAVVVWPKDRIEVERFEETQGAFGPDRKVFDLIEGNAEFRVPKRTGQKTFRVRVGQDAVVVRGTTFRVEARGGALRAVDVSEGKVEVHIDGRLVATLGRRERWRRAPKPTPEPVPSPPSEPTLAPEVRDEPIRLKRTTRRVRAKEVPVMPEPVAPIVESLPSADELFVEAWRHYRRGEYTRAAAGFEELLKTADLDAERRSEILFWSAKSHSGIGAKGIARQRLRSLIERHPGAWHVRDARGLIEQLSEPENPPSAVH